jgi:membrane protease YdiL (CAAX protease family)
VATKKVPLSSAHTPILIKPFSIALLRQAIVWALLLSILFVAMRMIGTMGGKLWLPLLPLSFVLMMLIPWLLLTAPARRQIGLARATSGAWYGVAVIAGVAAASLCYVIGVMLFDRSADYWFVSVANNYRSTMNTANMDVLRLHLIFTIPALLFSPIGEEIFFRGFLQKALQEKFSVTTSTLSEAGLFGVIHLCHHGLFLTATGIGIHPVSGATWVALMFATALLFAWLRQRSGSLYPAMLCHAAFNATMNVWIFSMLWK